MADISVELKVITKDKLRQIIINLEKETNVAGKSTWTMDFTLNDRAKKEDKFEEVISLKVKIKPSLASKAEATAKDPNGLDNPQTAQALVAGDAAKAVKDKVISEKSAKTEAERIIGVRAAV